MRRKFGLFALLMLWTAGTSLGGVIIDKVPNIGPWWQPLSSGGSYVYADSFVFTGGSDNLLTAIGAYMRLLSGDTGSLFRFELLADVSNSPDPTTVLATTAALQLNNTSLGLVTASLLSPVALSSGTRYWIAVSTVGLSGPGSGAYQFGGHAQNSVYEDGGTFWYSNDPTGINFDGQGLTPEIAIFAETGAVPEPATCMILSAGLIALAALRRLRTQA